MTGFVNLAGAVQVTDPERLTGSDGYYMVIVLLVFGGFWLFMRNQK